MRFSSPLTKEAHVVAESPPPSEAAHEDDSKEHKDQSPRAADLETWSDLVKGSKRLQKKGKPYQLPTGESCVEIPDTVIEKTERFGTVSLSDNFTPTLLHKE